MKIKYPGGIDRSVLVASGQLPKDIHVAKLQLVGCIGIEGEANEKTILIKCVIYYLVTKIEVYFVV
jgi:hypothetical protein